VWEFLKTSDLVSSTHTCHFKKKREYGFFKKDLKDIYKTNARYDAYLDPV
jgi:hypothetical protein